MPKLANLRRLSTIPKIILENFVGEDVFSPENESGQKVIDCLFVAAEKYKDDHGSDLLLSMPTFQAYETEVLLVEGIRKHSKGE